jgi:transcriptional regulator with GAF, ATPase, and Fis domain
VIDMETQPRDREARLAELFVKLSDTLVTGFDIVDLLEDLAEGTVDLLGVSSAGIMLSDQRRTLRAMASSSETARALELLELQNAEGPCLDSFTNREMIEAPDLSKELERWPRFAAAASKAGVVGAYAVPLRLRTDTLGALNLFTASATPLSRRDLQVAQALADAATIAVLNHRATIQQVRLTEQLQTALNSRVVIEQAKGVISSRTGGDMGLAFHLLRRYARGQQMNLTVAAEKFASGTLQADDLLMPGAPIESSGPSSP